MRRALKVIAIGFGSQSLVMAIGILGSIAVGVDFTGDGYGWLLAASLLVGALAVMVAVELQRE